MKYRKGKRGLYYEDGRLYRCDYNYYNASIWQHYKWAIQNIDLEQVLEIFKNLFLLIILIPTLPFCGIIHKIVERRNIKNNSYIKKSDLNQRFPKDYYEELES